jgi:hypothetical protein
LAPNAPLRPAVTAHAGLPIDTAPASPHSKPETAVQNQAPDSKRPSRIAYLWAMLIARIYEISSLVCPRCGIEMRIIAFVTDAQPVERILTHLG